MAKKNETDFEVILPGKPSDYSFNKRNLKKGETIVVNGKTIHNDGKPEPKYEYDPDDVCDCDLCVDRGN